MRETGLFRKLLTLLIIMCENDNLPIVLLTHNPKNVAKYEHFGFKLIESIHSDKINITCYNMFKKPLH